MMRGATAVQMHRLPHLCFIFAHARRGAARTDRAHSLPDAENSSCARPARACTHGPALAPARPPPPYHSAECPPWSASLEPWLSLSLSPARPGLVPRLFLVAPSPSRDGSRRERIFTDSDISLSLSLSERKRDVCVCVCLCVCVRERERERERERGRDFNSSCAASRSSCCRNGPAPAARPRPLPPLRPRLHHEAAPASASRAGISPGPGVRDGWGPARGKWWPWRVLVLVVTT
jgi:hypothetical protein